MSSLHKQIMQSAPLGQSPTNMSLCSTCDCTSILEPISEKEAAVRCFILSQLKLEAGQTVWDVTHGITDYWWSPATHYDLARTQYSIFPEILCEEQMDGWSSEQSQIEPFSLFLAGSNSTFNKFESFYLYSYTYSKTSSKLSLIKF